MLFRSWCYYWNWLLAYKKVVDHYYTFSSAVLQLAVLHVWHLMHGTLGCTLHLQMVTFDLHPATRMECMPVHVVRNAVAWHACMMVNAVGAVQKAIV